jgi:hypothetical protein
MFEKLIENWLINVHELGYQIPFCEALLTEKYKVLHVSRHGPGERGKDIVARNPNGELVAYQLKGGDIKLPEWHKIRGEVEELVQLPVSLPSITKPEAHIPYLVTNGEIQGDALDSIQMFAETWQRQGYPRLQIIQRHELLAKFVTSHGSYLPTKLVDFRQFVELYISDFYDRIPREKFSFFLFRLVDSATTKGHPRKIKRAIESMVLTGSYIVEQYERVENHISAAEGWTTIAATIMHVIERDGLKPAQYQSSLDLVWMALDKNLKNLEKEVLDRGHFVEPNFPLAETDNVRGARVAITLGWITSIALIRSMQKEVLADKKKLLQIVKREIRNMKVSGEVDWPIFVALSLYLEEEVETKAAENFIGVWVRLIVNANLVSYKDIESEMQNESKGMAPPYWLQEKVMELGYGMLPPYQKEKFTRHCYTVQSALDMLVRRFCRQQVSIHWPRASRLTFCDFVPDDHADWFLWRIKKGNLWNVNAKQPVSWSAWQKELSKVRRDSVPAILMKHPKWILPFALTYPHRLNRALSAIIDCVIGGRSELI